MDQTSTRIGTHGGKKLIVVVVANNNRRYHQTREILSNTKQRDFIRDLRINNSMRYSSNRLPRVFQNVDHLININRYNELGDASRFEKALSAVKNNILIVFILIFEMMLFSLRFLALVLTGKWK
jgi:hypothetical protein